ncbi:uncharacterized protein LOC106656246 isoform X1 [Trichogramma pretiosum]|uniref:uncharacterized protein LOC106656246 isoform X1 n=1 Tax=Trichogramma pretiosum TaxID=7493 RepID=UPI0006C99391|nr:uncharacterized protein LOC106656246 isoform X1 [Trichogramma pretiosum]
MVHPLLVQDAWAYWVISAGALVSFVGLVVACICSCRRNDNKSEFLGLAGMVTITHPDGDGFGRITPVTETLQITPLDTVDGCGKRSSTANRSLPDIPKDKVTETDAELGRSARFYDVSENIGSDPLDLYATVNEKHGERADKRNKQSISQQSSQDETASLYARLQTPPTSSGDEHPYAKVQNVSKTENSNRNSNHVVDLSQPSTSSGLPVAPPRSRRSSSHNSLLDQQQQQILSQAQPSQDIQAASAITGGVQANQDLPYMTPPIIMPPLPNIPQPADAIGPPQQHFSGDSADSKGYTSISVREPLANLIAQTKNALQQRRSEGRPTDPHYATVSDDSDEMYAAIDEQEKIYTSESETYAQIQPVPVVVTVEINRPSSGEPSAPARPGEIQPYAQVQAPQPPSVDSLRHVAHVHSRQASSSSVSSSIAPPSSPKPEKRQANSPLPPPPDKITDVYAIIDKRNKTDRAAASSSSPVTPGKSLEDMYAKVMKKKGSGNEEEGSPINYSVEPAHSASGVTSKARRKLSLIEPNRASWSSHESGEVFKREQPSAVKNVEDAEFDDGYEAVMASGKNKRLSAPVVDANYETIRPVHHPCNMPSTSSRNGVDSSMPIYSMPFKHRQISNASSEDPGYERVRLRRRTTTDDEADDETYDSEPNYESMPHEPNYASVSGRPSDYEPNYESVSNGDPNYESVKYTNTRAEPSQEPPYERLEPNYERIRKVNNNGSADTDDEQYVQV